MSGLDESITKWTLHNAREFGSAQPPKVLGKVLAEHPECKKDVKGTLAKIGQECARVNALGKEELDKELSLFQFDEPKPADEEGERKITVPDAVQGRVVTRFPPEPSGFPHIGHAKAAFLDYEIAKQNGGYMRLRMDDTNPEKEKAEFVDALVDGLKWLGISWEGEITYTSDRMEEFYAYADELILKHKAYVCTCSPEDVKKGREKGEECLCRTQMAEDHILSFRKMIAGKFPEGGAVLRYRGHMKAENTVMRDPTLFRIIEAPHYRQGANYKCWPSYDFEAPIMDSVEGITHALRSKEYELRDELYYALQKALDLRPVRMLSISRLAIAGAPISKRLITPLITEGKVSGYDDPRLPTLAALRRRGIRPQAIRQFVLSFGLSKVESEPGWEKLLSYNRKLIDATALRRFFVPLPVKLEVSGAPARILALKNHPQNASMGTRSLEASSPLFIPGRDAAALTDGEVFRLKDWCNVKLSGKREEEVLMPDGSKSVSPVLLCEFVSESGDVSKKVQWLSDAHKARACVFVPGDLLRADNSYNPDSLQTVWGWAEPSCAQLAPGTTVQFERFGFATLDKAEGDMLSFIQVSD
ncbi:Glutamate--tRNA ligase [uncultured archaeon]|nr:Glutamate--tRNA ligase [uncultured archaeon]